MDGKQRESTSKIQPQMDADLRRLGTANGHEMKGMFSVPQLLGFESRGQRNIPGLGQVIADTPAHPFAVSQYRAGGIRTHDLLNPIQAHYQAVLRPEFSENGKDAKFGGLCNLEKEFTVLRFAVHCSQFVARSQQSEKSKRALKKCSDA